MMKEAGLPLDALVAHGRSMMRWGLDNQDGFADSPYSSVGEARHCWGKSSWRIDSAIPKNGTSPCGTISIVGASNWLSRCCKSIEARMQIPEAAGGLRLRYDARPWIIIMASVHYMDNAGEMIH
jgi:hypothetical protein